MAIEILKENLCLNQIVGKSKENIVVEGDVIIPDIKPDILSAINTCGNICIYKKEILEGKIRIDGGVQVYIMYLTDDENSIVRGINTVIDFSKTIEMENVDPTMTLESNFSIKDIECKILNGRKVSVKIDIDSHISVYSNNNIEFIKNIENAEEMQILNKTDCIDSLIGVGNTKVYAKETINIPENDNLAEILKLNLSIIDKEVKTSYNKILVKANIEVRFLYLTEENQINESNIKIPVMGFIDMQNISDDNVCNTNFEIKNILVKPNSTEEHSVFVEAELEISCSAYEKKNIEIIQDLYSPIKKLNLSQKNVNVMKDKSEISTIVSIKELLNIPELSNSKTCDSEIIPQILKINVQNGRIVYEGEAKIRFIFISDANNRMNTITRTIPFTGILQAEGVDSSWSINTIVSIISHNIETKSDSSVEIEMEMQLNADVSKMMEFRVIDNIEELDDDDENIYSIIVYFVKPGDTIWDIAKRFKSTIKAISTVNGLEDVDKIDVGQQLFIPKFV